MDGRLDGENLLGGFRSNFFVSPILIQVNQSIPLAPISLLKSESESRKRSTGSFTVPKLYLHHFPSQFHICATPLAIYITHMSLLSFHRHNNTQYPRRTSTKPSIKTIYPYTTLPSHDGPKFFERLYRNHVKRLLSNAILMNL